MTRGRSRLLPAVLAGFALSADGATAQSYPQRPVKIVAAVVAGSTGDIVARAVADRLSASLQQTFVVENRPGAGGNIGAEFVAKAPADGQTLLVSIGSTMTVNPHLYRKLPFNPETDLRPISIMTTSSTMLVVHPSMPARSVSEFVALAKKEPISYATGGNGTPSHLAMEYFRQRAGFQATPVPYRGNAPLATDLVGGQIKVSFPAIGSVIAYVREEKLRALAVSSASRSRLAPLVPTMTESGYPDLNIETQMVLSAPASTPIAITRLLEHEVQQALKSPDLAEKLRIQGYEIAATTADEAAARLSAERALWAKVVKAGGMQVD